MNGRAMDFIDANQPYLIVGFLAFAMISALYLMFRGGAGINLPTLVLEDFYVSSTPRQGLFVVIAGRPVGLWALFLSILGLGMKVRFEVSKESVQREVTKGDLHIIDSVPLPNVASTTYGYSKQSIYLWLALVAFLGGLAGGAGALFMRGQENFVAAVAGSVCIFFSSFVLFLFYHLSARLEVAIETNGGRPIGLRFKPSIIGSLSIDLKDAAQAVEIINSLIR